MASVIKTEYGQVVSTSHHSVLRWSPDGAGRKEVVTTDAGAIYCQVCQDGWCDHISVIIKTNGDSKALFKDYWNEGVSQIIVPIFPIDRRVYAQIELGHVSESVLSVSLWNCMSQGVKGMHEKLGPQPLGLITQGDGRATIRSLVVDWVASQVNLAQVPDPKSCVSFRHSAIRHAAFRNDYQTSLRAASVQTWCILWYHKCFQCLDQEGVLARFDSDLIPTSS